MAFSTERSIIAQNAANVAAQLVQAVAGEGLTPEQVADLFTQYRDAVFQGTLALADDPALTESTGRQPRTTTATSGDAINFGKYKGQSWQTVVRKDRRYVEWLAQNSNSDQVRARASKVLATAGGSVDDPAADEPF